MKAYDFSHWNLDETKKGLLFFAQSLEEMLFHYGHDSLKVPALNFHFLCIEIQLTIKKIEDEVVDKSNMRPLFEELKYSFNHDPIVQKIFGRDFDSFFFKKDVKGDFERNCKDIYKDPCSETSLKRIKFVVNYFINEISLDNKYYSYLKSHITSLIKSSPITMENQKQLYLAIRILLTELINSSYSQEYIYHVVDSIFYNSDNPINDIDDILLHFWAAFDFERKEYSVIFPLKTDALQKHLQQFKDINIKKNIAKLFGNSCKWVVELNTKAMDPYKAQFYSLTKICFFASLLQYNNHNCQSFNAEQSIVTLKSNSDAHNIQIPIKPLQRVKLLSKERRAERLSLMINSFSFLSDKLVNVIELHSSALNSAERGNQILNLWTIIEILISAERKNTFSKINQICNVIVSVLNSQYIPSLINNLLIDLQRCIPETLSEQLSHILKGSTDDEKLTALLVLNEYQPEYSKVFDKLHQYPLLQYRMEQYAQTFSDKNNIKVFLEEHRTRLSWHITRIYRNRNMIVHDGTHFPYINIIVQNLHYYVDQLIDTINLFANRGYHSLNIIYTVLQHNEYEYWSYLEKKDTDGSSKITDSDFLKIVLGYIN